MRLIFLIFILSTAAFSAEFELEEDSVIFPGRVSRINSEAKLVRVKINFENAKFLRKNDRVEFWNESQKNKKCLAYIRGRTSNYLLLRVVKFKSCVTTVYLTTGSYLHFYSVDLENSLKVAKSLVDVLLKKQLALKAKKSRLEIGMRAQVEKIDALNKRYEVLRQKLEIEWQKELASLEEDKVDNFSRFQKTESMLNELEYKLRQYRVQDQNFVEDRWSLDPKLYYKK